MRATTQDIVNLVETTVTDLGGKAQDVMCDGTNILIKNKPLAISKIMACKHSCAKFVDLIRSNMG